MQKSKGKKAYKYILSNPLNNCWSLLSLNDTEMLIKAFTDEIIKNSSPSIRIEEKKQKINENDVKGFCGNHLILGINRILASIDQISTLFLVWSLETQVLLEPLQLIARHKSIKTIVIDYKLINSQLRYLTGIEKLAAFGIPKMNCFETTLEIINQIPVQDNPSFQKPIIRQVEIVRGASPKKNQKK